MNYLKRFDTHQRIQHILLLTTFILLAITGLPVLYRNSWGMGVIEFFGGLQMVHSIHKWAAYGMIFTGIYHVVWALIKRPKSMIPSKKDFQDFIQDLKFVFGKSKDVPKYDKFSYVQKFEYWGAFWGMVLMILTGLVLFYPEYFPLPISFKLAFRIAHADEAILAVAFIISWHMYFSHLRKRMFPFNKVVFTGKMEVEKAREEHPLWVEKEVKNG